MRDLADDLLLIQIKAQFHADILEVVIAAGGKRLVRPGSGNDYGEPEHQDETKSAAMPAPAFARENLKGRLFIRMLIFS